MDVLITPEMREQALREAYDTLVDENLRLRAENLALRERLLGVAAELEDLQGDREQEERRALDYMDIPVQVEGPEAEDAEMSIP